MGPWRLFFLELIWFIAYGTGFRLTGQWNLKFPKPKLPRHHLFASLSHYDPEKIRNFCIIAHIDHGKSTLADRLLERTNTIPSRNMQQQVLDSNPIERERGITIKLQAARMKYESKDGNRYLLNLIDTPGHVDFGYEVSRSLAACEGAILVVDATQGVEAQTLANAHLAKEHGLKILPVLNKIDLPSADHEKCIVEIETALGLACEPLLLCSAKTGEGVENILEAIVRNLPSPVKTGQCWNPTRALIFDSYFDQYKGVIPCIRLIDGSISKGDRVRFINSNAECDILDVGVMTPDHVSCEKLQAGEVGYITGAIRSLMDARVGDTITVTQRNSRQHDGHELQNENEREDCFGNDDKKSSAILALPGYQPARPMVYAGFYPVDSHDYENARDALSKLILNDASFSFTPESSAAMGHGFRCGFLGLLHMDVIQERLEREYGLDIVVTSPSVVYKARIPSGDTKYKEILVDCPCNLPDVNAYVGDLMKLAQLRRGIHVTMNALSEDRFVIVYEIPLAEVITDFFDKVKSLTRGYGSMSMKDIGYRRGDLIKLEIRINGELIPPLTAIIPRDSSQAFGRKVCAKLKDTIPREQFKINIQACIGVKPIASEQISPYRKDVEAKCKTGGDVTRKNKLLEKQIRGKKRMKLMGKVTVPQEAFMSIVQRSEE